MELNKDTRHRTTLIKHSEARVRKRKESCKIFLNPNVAGPFREKTRKSRFRRRRTAHSPPAAEYLTVREVLSEVSTASDGVLSRERSGFCRSGFATQGLTKNS